MAELKASVQGLRGLGFRVWVSEFRVLQLFRARDACCKRVLGGLGFRSFGFWMQKACWGILGL